MSIESEITRLVEAKQGLADWLTEQNVSVPNGALLGDLVALLDRVKTASTENAIVLKSTATISNGEIIVPGVAIDVRALDNLCAALAIQANTPNYMLCMTGSKAMVTNSSYTLNITDIKADAVRGIGEPPFVRFLIAKDGKSIVMEPYNRKVFASMRVPPTMYNKTGQRARMEIKCVPFCRYLAACLGWDDKSTYRVPGRVLPQQCVVLFDLTKAYSIHIDDGRCYDGCII